MVNPSLLLTSQSFRQSATTLLLITVEILFSATQSRAADPASPSRQELVAAGSNSVNTPDLKSVANSSKVIRYAQNRISKYDMNRDGILQADEWKAMKGNPEQIDADKDGVITQEELATWIAAYQLRRSKPASSPEPVSVQPNVPDTQTGAAAKPESLPQSNPDAASTDADSPLTSQPKRQRDQKFYVSPKRLPDGLPDWFLTRDKDGDGQLTEAEFSTTGSSQELAEFKGFDANGDGVVTAKECTGKTKEKKSGAAGKPTSDGLPSANPDATPKSRRKTKTTK